MYRYQVLIEYEGTNFIGWQIQKKGNSIQGLIQKKFSKILKEKIIVVGSGRTDSGVHAKAQTAHVKVTTDIDCDKIQYAINGNIGNDVYISNCSFIDENFHARFSAKERRYEYYTVLEETPFTHKRAWCLKYDVDFNLLNECAVLVVGNHDFTAFCKANADVKHKRCIVFDSKWEKTSKGLTYHVKANRFLQHMVRFLVGTIVEVGRGRMTIDDFKLFMDGGHPELAVVRAPAHGLYLKEVSYA